MKLNSARKFTAALGLFAGLGVVVSWAQPAPASPAKKDDQPIMMEKVVTTGTRLGTAASQADIPIVVIGKLQIEQTPVVEVADYLKNLPAFTGSGNTNESITNGGSGGRSVDLRGLGSQYTLVLINGRRLSYSGTGNVVDVNQIPESAVDHLEVVTNGASAVYGSEAIGGVVNIITKKGYTGAEVNAYFGDTFNSPKKDLSRRQFSFNVGSSDGKMEFLFGGQYFKQNGIYSNDNPWSSSPGPTSNTFPYRFRVSNAVAQNVFGITSGFGTAETDIVVKWKPGEGGRRDAAAPADFRVYQGRLPNVANPDAGGDQFPFYLYTPLLRPEERYNFFTFTSYQLNENVKAFGSLMYRYAYSYNQLAPAAVPVPALGAIKIPATNYWNQRLFGAKAVDIVKGGWRFVPLGPRLDTAELTGVWTNAGLEGKLADYNWRIEALFTQEIRQFMNGGTTSVDLLNAELAKDTPDAFNPFSSKLEANAAIWNRIKREAYDNQRSRLGNLTAQIDGKIFDTNAGPVNGALSAEWNKLRAYDHPDALNKAIPLGFNGTGESTDAARTTWGVAAEVDIPILKELSLRPAGRHDNYSDFGGVTVGQAAIRYTPNKEMLFRGSFGQGFIAPSLLQLYEGAQVTNPVFFDPSSRNSATSWGANNQVSMTRIGNSRLQPEKADMFNLGFAYSPNAIKNLTVTIDYWNVKQTNVVSSAESYAAIVARRFWEALGSTDAARDTAARNPTTRAAAVNQIRQSTGVTVVYDPSGGANSLGGLSVDEIALQNVYRTNLAGAKAAGVDLAVSYQYRTPAWGTYTIDVKGTYTQQYDQQAMVGEPYQKLAGLYSTAYEGGWPRWRIASVLGWSMKDWGANIVWHYTKKITLQDGMDATYGRDFLPQFSTFDAQVSYKLPWLKSHIQLGVENAFAKVPPLTEFALNNDVPAGLYDVKGRMYYVRFSQKF
jgi:iron complex outermembrane receptor protein